ncbi:hypothetical protein LINGRAHAP2_LOCUS25043 [Linum grandiflorum]
MLRQFPIKILCILYRRYPVRIPRRRPPCLRHHHLHRLPALVPLQRCVHRVHMSIKHVQLVPVVRVHVHHQRRSVTPQYFHQRSH